MTRPFFNGTILLPIDGTIHSFVSPQLALSHLMNSGGAGWAHRRSKGQTNDQLVKIIRDR